MTHIASVLVLDGEQRSALAAVRSLGRAGAQVQVASARPQPLAGASRHVSRVWSTPDPMADAQGWVDAVLHHAAQGGVQFILPMTDVSTALLAPLRARLPPGCSLLCPSAAAYEALTDKQRLLDLATRVDVAVPRTLVAQDAEQLQHAAAHLGYPLVIKPARSRYVHGNAVHSTSVILVRDAQHLQAVLPTLAWLGHVNALVQQWVPGTGAGVFALYGPEGPVAWFAHRRLREKPPSGGVSVLCESTLPDPAVLQPSARLLESVGWWGPAMVEYRVTPSGEAVLMEVNGRFWGSLQLAIDAGVDFPALLLDLGLDRPPRAPQPYANGRRLRWLLGDVDNLLLQWRAAATFSARRTALGDFLATFFDARCRQEVLRLADPRPGLREWGQWLAALR